MIHVKEILGGLAALLAFLGLLAAVFVTLYFTGQHNAQKVQQLTTLCVQSGYTGWQDGRGSGQVGCYR